MSSPINSNVHDILTIVSKDWHADMGFIITMIEASDHLVDSTIPSSQLSSCSVTSTSNWNLNSSDSEFYAWIQGIIALCAGLVFGLCLIFFVIARIRGFFTANIRHGSVKLFNGSVYKHGPMSQYEHV